MSEKVFEGLFSGAVPVYRGTNSVYKFMPGNNSFIDANGLTPRQLADKLLALSKNEVEYEKYFSFKTENDGKLSAEFERIALMSYSHPNVMCRLCEKVFQMQSGDGSSKSHN